MEQTLKVTRTVFRVSFYHKINAFFFSVNRKIQFRFNFHYWVMLFPQSLHQWTNNSFVKQRKDSCPWPGPMQWNKNGQCFFSLKRGTFKCARARSCPFFCNVEKLSGPKRSIRSLIIYLLLSQCHLLYNLHSLQKSSISAKQEDD